MKEFKEITSKNCYYCDASPKYFNFYLHKSGKLITERTTTIQSTIKHAGIYFNGIDRVDNSLGYVENNMVPCCRLCNEMKRNISKEMIYKIMEFLKNK